MSASTKLYFHRILKRVAELSELRQYCLAEEFGLFLAVVTPDFQHDVGAPCLAKLRDPLAALVRCSCDRTHLP
jgi:hypothetical protein